MFNNRKKITQIEKFSGSGVHNMESINSLLKRDDIEYVDLKTDERGLFLIYNQYVVDTSNNPF